MLGSGLVLQLNDGSTHAINSNGEYKFPGFFRDKPYSVTVSSQPTDPAQTCTLANASGTMPDAAVTNVNVTCTTNTYAINVTVSGLAGSGLVLRNDGNDVIDDELAIPANGTYTFTAAIHSGKRYAVTVNTQPTSRWQTCAVTNGTGTVADATISNITVTCVTNTYTVGGTVSGLIGAGLVLRNNGGDNLAVTSNGNFTFATAIDSGSNYAVTVYTPPNSPTQTCTVNNGSGTVTNAAITSVSLICSVNAYTVGGTISGLAGRGLTLQNNGADDLTLTSNGPYNFATSIASGANYTVTIKSQPKAPEQLCTLSNPSGMLTSGPITNVDIECKLYVARFAYVVNQDDDTLSIFTVDAATGQLRPRGYALTGTTPVALAADPSGKYVYVTNRGNNTLSIYSIDAKNGALTNVATMATVANPAGIAIDPYGKFAYVISYVSNTVSTYSIDSATGALTAMGDAPTGTFPRRIVIDPAGKYLYVANESPSEISAYTINSTTGALTSTGANLAAGGSIIDITIDPLSRFVYTADATNSSVLAFSITPVTGALTSVGAAAANNAPHAIRVDATGKYAYATGVNDPTNGYVSKYDINQTTGALTLSLTDHLFSPGSFYRSITTDPSGVFAFAADYTTKKIVSYNINAGTGALTQTAIAPIAPARKGPVAIALVRGMTPVTYTPKFAYVANQSSNDVSVYSINASTGELTGAGTIAMGAGNFPLATAVDPLGKFAYITTIPGLSPGTVRAYAIDSATGSLTAMGNALAVPYSPNRITIDPSGRFVYVQHYSGTYLDGVMIFSINPSTGALTSAGAQTLAGAHSFTIDPSGQFAYITTVVAGLTSTDTYVYNINPSTGALANGTKVIIGGQTNYPVDVALDPSGRFAFVSRTGELSVFTVDRSTGAFTSASSLNLGGAISTTVDNTGQFAYVTKPNSAADNVGIYTINQFTGALTSVSTITSTAPNSTSIDFSGKFAYAVSRVGTVAGFTVNPTTGALTSVGTSVPTGTSPQSIVTTGTIQ